MLSTSDLVSAGQSDIRQIKPVTTKPDIRQIKPETLKAAPDIRHIKPVTKKAGYPANQNGYY